MSPVNFSFQFVFLFFCVSVCLSVCLFLCPSNYFYRFHNCFKELKKYMYNKVNVKICLKQPTSWNIFVKHHKSCRSFLSTVSLSVYIVYTERLAKSLVHVYIIKRFRARRTREFWIRHIRVDQFHQRRFKYYYTFYKNVSNKNAFSHRQQNNYSFLYAWLSMSYKICFLNALLRKSKTRLFGQIVLQSIHETIFFGTMLNWTLFKT